MIDRHRAPARTATRHRWRRASSASSCSLACAAARSASVLSPRPTTSRARPSASSTSTCPRRGSPSSPSASPPSARALYLCPKHPLAGVGPPRRRLGRDRRAVHRAHAGHRLDLGPPHVGRLLDVGRPPHHDGAAVRPLPRLPGPAPAAGRRHEQRAKRCAIAGLLAFVDVPDRPLVSVEWWRTLHQDGHRPRDRQRPDRRHRCCSALLRRRRRRSRSSTLWLLVHQSRIALPGGRARRPRPRPRPRRAPGRRPRLPRRCPVVMRRAVQSLWVDRHRLRPRARRCIGALRRSTSSRRRRSARPAAARRGQAVDLSPRTVRDPTRGRPRRAGGRPRRSGASWPRRRRARPWCSPRPRIILFQGLTQRHRVLLQRRRGGRAARLQLGTSASASRARSCRAPSQRSADDTSTSTSPSTAPPSRCTTRASPAELFKAGIPVVLEGRMGTDGDLRRATASS